MTLTAAGLAAAVPALPASAASGACTTSGSTVTCTFTETGAAQTWTVPAGVTSATFTLYGARGGSAGGLTPDAGLGAEVTAALAVTPGTVLQVNVGQAGTENGGTTFGGGGGASGDGGTGGGASDVRSPAADGTYPLAGRLLVAGGAGGSGDFGFTEAAGTVPGGAGGPAGSPGGNGQSVSALGATLGGGGGGGTGGATSGGAAGAGGTVSGTSTCSLGGIQIPPFRGSSGVGGSLGTGGSGSGEGGGGGGGYYGGGGGGGQAFDACVNEASGGGGGGGSSYTGGVAGATVTDGVAAPDDTPNGEVIITYTVTVPPLSVTTTSLPGGQVGVAYGPATLAATGGVTPYSWSVTGGSLPAGLSLNSAGVISGTPTAFGTFTFTVTVTDAESPAMTASQALSVTIKPPPLSVTTTSLPGGQVGSAYGPVTLAATGGVTPYTWSLTTGSLPIGLSMASTTGVISGTPDAYGTFSFTVKVTDSENPAMTASQALSIVVKPAPLVITTTSLPAATGGSPYSATLAATGGVTPYAWSVTSGSLPPGLSLTASTGVISGTPDVAGTYSFTVTVTDAESPAMTASVTLSISVSGPVITSLRPASGPTFGDTPVIISGTGLSCPAGAAGCHVTVTFGGKPATVEFMRPGEIGVISPPGSGTVTVTVTVGGVSSQATAADQFTYVSPLVP